MLQQLLLELMKQRSGTKSSGRKIHDATRSDPVYKSSRQAGGHTCGTAGGAHAAFLASRVMARKHHDTLVNHVSALQSKDHHTITATRADPAHMS